MRGKGCFFGLLLLGAVGGMVLLMAWDIRQVISIIPGRDPEKEIPIRMYNTRIHKVLSEDAWVVEAPLLEKERDLLRGYSLDLRMEGPRGRGASFFAERGTVDLDNALAILENFHGSLWGDERGTFEVAASQGHWEEGSRTLLLEGGFVLSSDQGVARGESAVLHQDRTVEVRTKAVLEWQFPE